jgi:hypothetical protein
MICRTQGIRFRTPRAVMRPTVSHAHTRRAPASIAVVNRRRIVSGVERTVSSVTNMTGSPFCVA